MVGLAMKVPPYKFTWEGYLYILCAVAMVFMPLLAGWKITYDFIWGNGAQHGWRLPIVVLCDAVLVSGAAYIAALALPALSTTCTERGVRQMTFRGSVFIPWNEVTRVTIDSHTIGVESSIKSISVNWRIMQESDALIKAIRERIPASAGGGGQRTNSSSTHEQQVAELKPSVWVKPFSVLTIIGGYIMFCILPLWRWISSPMANTAPVIVAFVALIGGGLWFITQGAFQLWDEAAFRVRLDETGVTLHTRAGIQTASWSQIACCTVEDQSEQGKSGWWVTLRDEQGEVLMQWNRDWYTFTESAIRRFDSFTSLLHERIASVKIGP